MIWGILFLSGLSVYLSVVNFNICYNFWTVGDRDFICKMHSQLIIPFQMTPRSVTLTLTFVLKKAFFDFVAAGCIVFHKHRYFSEIKSKKLESQFGMELFTVFVLIAKRFRPMQWSCLSICLSVRLTLTVWLSFALKFRNLLCNPALPYLMVSCMSFKLYIQHIHV